MSLNTSEYIELINSLLTVMTSFDVDTEEAGEAYLQLKDELLNVIEANDIDVLFEMLVYIITLTKLALATGHTDFHTFWRHYLLSLESASDSFLLSSCAEVEAVIPHLRYLMTGETDEDEDDAEAIWDADDED